MNRQIGFIGLGVMGAPMAWNLSRKFPGLRIFDVDQHRIESLLSRDRGSSPASSPQAMIPAASLEEIGSTCNLVILSLPTSEVVRTVSLGSGGLMSFLKKGSIVIDTSTTEVGMVQEISAALAERGISFLDAPMSGGEKAAIEGTLSFMVGGEEQVFETCKPYLSAMGTSVVRTGSIGMGQVAKCVNQIIVGATFAAIAESFALGTRSGLDPKILYDAIKGGWAGSKLLDVAAKDMFSREFKPGGTVDIHWKDLGYALSLAKGEDVPTPVTAIVHEIFKAARAAGEGKRSQPAVVRLWERLLGIEVQ
ncbi:MAG: 2-hydroxy-3-oxopropionate reductase [Spirochaetales bacterium]